MNTENSAPAVPVSFGTSTDPEAVRAERDQLAQRHMRLAELLNCPPAKIEHEIRNVLNELKLLRTLFETQEKQGK